MRIRLALAILSTVVLAACSGGEGESSSGADDSALTGRLAAAKERIDAADALDVTIATETLPSGVTGLLSAEGVGNHSPAFSGDVRVVTGGTALDAEVVAVDGQVWVKSLLFPTFQTLDPAALGAPDPAVLLGTDGTGISSILTETTVSGSDRSRDGGDVLTTISGTLGGEVVARYLPTADPAGTFDVTYRLDDEDVLRDATIRGPFYPGAKDVTYTLRLSVSTSGADIIAPARPGGA